MHKSIKIIEEINESNNIRLNIQPPQDLKGRPIVGGPNSPIQGIIALLEKILTSILHVWKHILMEDWGVLMENYHLMLIITVY